MILKLVLSSFNDFKKEKSPGTSLKKHRLKVTVVTSRRSDALGYMMHWSCLHYNSVELSFALCLGLTIARLKMTRSVNFGFQVDL